MPYGWMSKIFVHGPREEYHSTRNKCDFKVRKDCGNLVSETYEHIQWPQYCQEMHSKNLDDEN